MKKLFPLFAALLLTLGLAAQTSPLDEIQRNVLLSASQYTAYVDPAPDYQLTPAPKGYEPFYLTHYGRHGSRWLIRPAQYTDVTDVLERAHQQGALTPRGEQLWAALSEWLPSTDKRLGELTIVSRELRKMFDIENPVFFADLDWKALLKQNKQFKPVITDLPKFPAVKRDFALLVDKSVQFAELARLAYQTEKKYLKNKIKKKK